MLVFINGQFIPEEQSVVSVFDRAFLYGDGLFETMRVCGGKPFRWAQHLERLRRGAEFLSIPLMFTPDTLRGFVGQFVEQNQMPDAILRVTLSRGVGVRGYSPKGADAPFLTMSLHAVPPPLAANEPSGWSLITASIRIFAEDPLTQFKTCNKLPQIVARAEAEAKGADEALLLNTIGEVVEAASANLFWVYHDKVCTVPTGRGALPGITRAVVLEICQVLGLPTSKRVIKPEALRSSEGLFLTQSVRGVVPVVSLDGEPVTPSPLVEKISRTYGEMLAKA